ncbi:MAG TPA: MarR family transcriptional regulator [Gaiellaceae bacterium]|jgi:DNA-binding MarR family transcriptional regulator|nr:MarR family transcriptional regulator [Gaiellaceae bacterium]
MSTRSLEADALTELILEVFRLNGDLLSAGDRIAGVHGQTSSRWQVLGALRHGPETVAGIARVMGRARQSVQRTADRLEAEGIVEYVDNPAHRRAKLVRLTAAGEATLAGISALQVEWTNTLAAAIRAGKADIEAATDVLRQLRTELESPAANPKGGRPR